MSVLPSADNLNWFTLSGSVIFTVLPVSVQLELLDFPSKSNVPFELNVTGYFLLRVGMPPERRIDIKYVQEPTMERLSSATMWPIPPQCLVVSPMRAAGRPSMSTCGSPDVIVNVLGPQHAACLPTSPTRAADSLLINTFELPLTIGPFTVWGHLGQGP